MMVVRQHYPVWLCSVLVLAFAAGLWDFVHRVPVALQEAGRWDFRIFVQHAETFLQTGKLYQRDLSLYGPLEPVYKFPPLSAAMLVLLLQAQVSEALLLWLAGPLQLLLYFAVIIGLLRALVPAQRLAATGLAVLLAIVLVPTLEENLVRLQLEPWLLVCVALAVIAIVNGRDGLAGFLVGLAALLKLYPAVLLLYFVATRRWRALPGAVLALVAGTVFSVAVLGVAEHRFFLMQLLPVLLRETPVLDPENLSLCLYASHFGLPPAVNKLLSTVILVLMLAVAFRLLWQQRQQPPSACNRAAGFSAFVIAMLVGMPSSLWNYQLLLVVPVSVLSGCWLQQRALPGSRAEQVFVLLLALSIVCLHVGAAATVDETYYPASLPVQLAIHASRTATPFLLLGLLVFAGRRGDRLPGNSAMMRQPYDSK